ncbi:hypothetical protein [Roseovarius indicus]|nr:hypothetical protein [Roseovarius indicus]
MRARDPRFAKIVDRLGYKRRDMVAEEPADPISALREEYERVVGKRPFMGWDADKLREKIAAAKAG